jgi:N-acetylglucosaminyl-diphospho-decaprenol L-rhamnosyltransferase
VGLESPRRDLAVVIVNYNTREFLGPCLELLPAALGNLSAETWVVDNASTDCSAELVRERFANVHLIVSRRNGGYAYGNNLALRAAGFGVPIGAAPRFRHVALLNPDTEAPPGSLAQLVRFLDTNPAVGVCGPRVERPDGSLDRACRRGTPTPLVAFYQLSGLARLFPRSRHFARYNLTYLPEDRRAEVDAVVGACMLVRAEALRVVGLMDERFFMYGEDLDLCLRVRAAGWSVAYEPAVRLLHHKGGATRKSSERMIREFYRSMDLFHQKHFAGRTPLPMNVAVRAAVRLACWLALTRNAARPPERRGVGSASS